MMSWAGGWFFLMASEIFTVGSRDFRLPGNRRLSADGRQHGRYPGRDAGILTLVLTIILLDQLLWRPILAWAERFKVETIANEQPPGIVASRHAGALLADRAIHRTIFSRPCEWIDERSARRWAASVSRKQEESGGRAPAPGLDLAMAVGIAGGCTAPTGYGSMLRFLAREAWAEIGLGVLATLLRVGLAL